MIKIEGANFHAAIRITDTAPPRYLGRLFFLHLVQCIYAKRFNRNRGGDSGGTLRKVMQELRTAALDLLKRNRRKSGGFSYTVPSPDTYPYQWLWDSCFHAIALSALGETEYAKAEIRALVSKQFENGLIPHLIYWEKPPHAAKGKLDIAWGRDGTSSITQPPLIAYAVWRIFERDADTVFLERVYPALFHYYQYLLHERDPHARHLIGIINPDESGEDNSPRFDGVLNLPPVHDLEENFRRRLALVKENRTCGFDAPFCMKNFFWVKDVPFNAIMVENLRALSRIAEKLGRAYDAEFFDTEGGRIAEAMRELMLEDGVYWPTHGEHYEKIKVKTWAMFTPLFAHLPSTEEVEALLAGHFRNKKEFGSRFLLPTVALDEPSFDPRGFWRGPVWMAANWFLYRGLLNYGCTKEAGAVRDASRELLSQSGFREYFDPHSGEGLGAEQFTWGALIADME